MDASDEWFVAEGAVLIDLSLLDPEGRLEGGQ